MPVDAFPFQRQQPGHATEDVGGEMLNANPGKQQVAGIVCQQTDVLPSGLSRPAYETVARRQMARCRRPSQAGNRSVLGVDGRGRDRPFERPPAQIRTGAASAYGSYLG